MAGEQAEGPAGKKMAGMGTIEVTSLMRALEDILDVTAGSRTVDVRSLEVQHAAALVEMLHFQTSRRRWEVQQFRKLKTFASADALLVILDDGLLPILAKEPTSLRALNLLERYANRLHTLSVSVGGTFEEEVDLVHQDLIQHVKQARAQPLAISLSELIDSTESIRTRISTLRDQVVGIGNHILSEGDGESSEESDG